MHEQPSFQDRKPKAATVKANCPHIRVLLRFKLSIPLEKPSTGNVKRFMSFKYLA